MSPEPEDPEEIEVDVNFEPDPTDLVLSSVPGGELFNPRKHRFSDEDLKPQPMIKKAKKVFVPEEQKVSYVWKSLSVCLPLGLEGPGLNVGAHFYSLPVIGFVE